MDYKWAKDTVLQLINQYSVAGDMVALSYNNQADYVVKIPALLDDAQLYIATTVRRIRKSVPLSRLDCEERGAWRVYALPEDCFQVCGGLVCMDGGEVRRSGQYHLLDDGWLAVASKVPRDALLEYYRRPAPLGTAPADDAQLDNTPEVQMALPYYVAAQLVLYDNAFAYQALLNEWGTRISRLMRMPRAEPGITEDAYFAQ